MVGQTLGHYNILAKLGAGGMGVVYRAEDTTLKRQVALKVLPSDLGDDLERLERFQREAETLAALDHPNIVTLYSVEEADGHHFLTMQLVEGRSLDELISTEGMSVNRVLKIAISLTEALRAAHDKSVVHRDLKPANVMLDREGRVKVLDFGLAKLRRSDFEEGSSLIATEAMTQEGVVLGTVPYMSPEQIQGEAVDHRTDLFSLGIMLHEMLCGARPFQASNTAALISSILRDPPIPAGEIKPGLPEKLNQILVRSMEKEPLLRYQSADQLWLELREVQSKLGGTASEEIEAAVERVLAKVPTGQLPVSAPDSEISANTDASIHPRQRKWHRWLAAIGILWGMIFAGYYVFLDRGKVDDPRTSLTTQLSYGQLTSQPGVEQIPSLSPDGQWVVYSGESSGVQDIYLQSVSGQTPFNLTEDSGANNKQPSFSPDGESIAFRSSREGGGIFIMGRTGEAARRVTRDGFNPAWSPDGTKLVYATESVDLSPLNWDGRSEMRVADLASGETQRLSEYYGVQPTWSPGGHRVAFVARMISEPVRMDISTIPVGGGERVAVTSDPAADWSPVWAPDGRHIYFVSDRSGSMNLWRIAVEEESGAAKGEPEPLTTPATFLAHPSLAADGSRVAYSSVLMTQNVQRLEWEPFTSTSKDQADWVTTGSILWSSPDVSPDGEWLVFYSRRPEGNLYIARTDGTGLRQLTNDEALDRVPRWSPDGEWIAFFSVRGGSMQVWKMRRDGSDLQQLTELEEHGSLLAWSPDGSSMAVMTALGTDARTVVFDPNRPWSEQTPQVLPAVQDSGPPFVVTSWSPDGAMLAGQAGYPGVGVMVYSFSTESYQRLTDFGEWPVWLPDSQRLMFVFEGKEFFVVELESKATQEIYSVPRDVIGPPRVPAGGGQVFFTRRVTEADIWLLTLGQ